MKRSVIAVLLAVLGFSCSDSTGPEGDGGSGGTVIAESMIDAQGGSVGNDEIELIIPAGAFGDEEQLTLSAIADDTFDTAISGTYIIEGLPASFSSDLSVIIAATGTVTDSTYLAVGTESWGYDTGGFDTAYRYFPATVADGTVTTTIPATAVMGTKPAQPQAGQTVSAKVTVVSGLGTHTTANGHFKIEYFSKYNTIDEIRYVGECLEEAYDTFLAMGFSYDRHSLWPVTVSVRAFDATVDGKYENTILGHLGGGIITLNALNLDDYDTIKITAGHEFFHFIQSLYDPRNWISRAKNSVPHLWLDEATSVWSEAKFSDDDAYVSAARAGNEMAPFTGVVVGALNDAEKQGYGLSAMIKYLADTYDEKKLITIYENLYKGDHPLTALKKATEDPVVWWETFIRRYFEGSIYNTAPTIFITQNDGIFQVNTERDTLRTYTDSYPDLSAKCYVVGLGYEDIEENAKIEFSVTGDFSDVAVYKYNTKPFMLTLLDTSSESVMVSDVKQLTEDGFKLLALVSNCANTEPYTDSTPITLTIRVKKPTTTIFISHLNYAWLSVGDINGVFSGGGLAVSGVSFGVPASAKDENTFEGVQESNPASGHTILENVSITIDQTRKVVSKFEATMTRRDWDNKLVENAVVEGYDIPMTANYTNLNSELDYVRFVLNGPSVKTHITNLEYTNVNTQLTDFNPDADSYIHIELKIRN